MITIINYGMGNVGSLVSMFKSVGTGSIITDEADEIRRAEKLVLPGVGAFDEAIRTLRSKDLIEPLEDAVHDQEIPILGVCLGMQLLTDGSEEGEEPGLGWISGSARRLQPDPDAGLNVPHMGWNTVTVTDSCSLTRDLPDNPRFYFAHSYYVSTSHETNRMFKTKYTTTFDSGVRDGNVYGVQFHPEKSHRFGRKILENFSEI